MWGIKFSDSDNSTEFPLITGEAIMVLAALLLTERVVIQTILQKFFCVRNNRQQHQINSLEYSYFYHLSIIVLLLSDLNWNLFDLSIWVVSYICVGMIRRAIHVVNTEKSLILNDYSYNNKIVTLFSSSKAFGIVLFFFSFIIYLFINVFFLGIQNKVTALLSFPVMMLVMDSFFMFICNFLVEKNILCFYNPNINQIPITYKYQMWHKIGSSSLKLWHFYNLLILFIKTLFEKLQIFDCMWIFSIVNAFYSSSKELVSSINSYRKFLKLQAKMDSIFLPNQTAKDQVCVICMQPLLNCRRLTNCGHLFHYKCLFQWIQTKYECPVCRVQINLNV